MRAHRYLLALTTLTTLATVATVSACSPHGRPSTEVSVQWDSGPLDRSYGQERADMGARHNQEIANPRADESASQQAKRQTDENKDLENRYAQGKASHANSMPQSNR